MLFRSRVVGGLQPAGCFRIGVYARSPVHWILSDVTRPSPPAADPSVLSRDRFRTLRRGLLQRVDEPGVDNPRVHRVRLHPIIRPSEDRHAREKHLLRGGRTAYPPPPALSDNPLPEVHAHALRSIQMSIGLIVISATPVCFASRFATFLPWSLGPAIRTCPPQRPQR